MCQLGPHGVITSHTADDVLSDHTHQPLACESTGLPFSGYSRDDSRHDRLLPGVLSTLNYSRYCPGSVPQSSLGGRPSAIITDLQSRHDVIDVRLKGMDSLPCTSHAHSSSSIKFSITIHEPDGDLLAVDHSSICR